MRDSGERPPLPEEAWCAVEVLGVDFAGRRVLDLGSGHGPEARALRRRGAEVIGLDVARPLLVQGLDLESDATRPIPRLQASADALPFEANSFDLVVAAQCWWWFDGGLAARACHRVLRAGGKLVILSYDWLPLPDNVVSATEALIEQHNPAWHLGGGNGLHPEWVADLTGFDRVHTFDLARDEPFSHASWRARIRASAGVGASLDPPGVEAFDRDLATLLCERFPDEPLQVAHGACGLVADVASNPDW